MGSDVNIKSYHVKHRLCLDSLLEKAKCIANYAVQNKKNRKVLIPKLCFAGSKKNRLKLRF